MDRLYIRYQVNGVLDEVGCFDVSYVCGEAVSPSIDQLFRCSDAFPGIGHNADGDAALFKPCFNNLIAVYAKFPLLGSTLRRESVTLA